MQGATFLFLKFLNLTFQIERTQSSQISSRYIVYTSLLLEKVTNITVMVLFYVLLKYVIWFWKSEARCQKSNWSLFDSGSIWPILIFIICFGTEERKKEKCKSVSSKKKKGGKEERKWFSFRQVYFSTFSFISCPFFDLKKRKFC